jgi:hypothetical protein
MSTSIRKCWKIGVKLLIIITLMIGWGWSCSAKRESNAWQTIQKIDTPRLRANAYLQFLQEYPDHDSCTIAINRILEIFNRELNNPDSALQFSISRLQLPLSPDCRRILYNFIFSRNISSPDTIHQLIEEALHREQQLSPALAAALILIPRLKNIFSRDSLRDQMLQELGQHLLQSGYDDVNNLIALSDSLVQYGDYSLLNLSDQFLIQALKANLPNQKPEVLPTADSLRNFNNFQIYLKLAWNAYHQQRYPYALHLISQTAKYGSLQEDNALILLGAIQFNNGETTDGWGHILQGLVLNPQAEIQSAEIAEIYTTLFTKIRGTRENPWRFLKQYRGSQH